MGGDENQRSVFDFLTKHLDSQERFSEADLEAVTSWQGKTFATYWSKQYKQFVEPAGTGKYRVTESFRPFTDWDKFQLHVTQVRRVAADYKKQEQINVTFEFFLPLSNEAHLRTTLDSLFFKDTILAKLRALDTNELDGIVPREPGENDHEYFDRICALIAPRFVGYSISHVNGRFRAEALCTRAETAAPGFRKRYLVDETTAVTRFIFPCKDTADAKLIRWFFDALFVRSIIQVVNGEDEIWMIESGLENRVYIWRVE